MQKTTYLSPIFALALVAGFAPAADAQTYVYSTGYQYGTSYAPTPAYNYGTPNYGTTNYGTPSYGTTGCISITSYLQIGSTDYTTGGQVSALQQFLNRTGYLNGVTGTFDVGTYGAVINYQNSHGISATGTVGPLTSASINAQSCGGGYVATNPYQYNNGYPYYNQPIPVSLTSLSATTGYPGQIITVYGTNLNAAGNASVHFGNSTVGVNSSSVNSLTFVVPALSTGSYQIYVSNSYGTTNSLPFTIINNQNQNSCYWTNNTYQCGCVTPVYSYSNGYTYNNSSSYNNCSNYNNGSNYGNGYPSVSFISGNTVNPGQAVTINGSNFTYNVTVFVNGNSYAATSYNNGTQIGFTVPYMNSGSYSLQVANSNGGQRSNSISLNVY